MPDPMLVVDDSPNILELFGLMFRNEGFEVTCCSNGKEALIEMARKTFNIVLTDMQMPLVDGRSLLTVVRRKYRATKVLFMSCYPMDLTELYLLGALDCFDKTVDRSELLTKVRLARANKRATRRYSLIRPALVNHRLQCNYVNISGDGVLLESRVPFREGTKVLVEFPVPKKKRFLSTVGEVVRNEPGPGGNQAAIHFLDNIGFELTDHIMGSFD